MTIVREAMVSDPRGLEASATAQDAAELPAPEEGAAPPGAYTCC